MCFIILLIPALIFLTSFYIYQRKKIISISRYENSYRILSELPRHTDLDTALKAIINSLTEILSAEKCTIYLLDENTNVLWTFHSTEIEESKIVLKKGEGIAGYVADTGKLLNIKYGSPCKELSINEKIKTVLASPVRNRKNNIIGVIELLNKKNKKNFTKEDENILLLFCTGVGNIIENLKLIEEQQILFESLLKAFATAVDARDPATRGHSLRVLKYVKNIAENLQLSQEEYKKLEYAAILHDVGKIGIPDEILSKQGIFTEEEYEIMKRHAIITRDILSKIHFPKEFNDVPFIASTHHEFLDGSGYPWGLKNEEIPFLSRILCIADIFDALISYDRPYKPPYSLEQSLQILNEMAQQGKIDKYILELFISKELYKIEKREFVRINKEVAFSWRRLCFEDIKSVLPIITKTKNISAGGFQFNWHEEIPANTFLEIELYLPNHTIEVIAKTIYCTKNDEGTGYNIGICFINLPKETQKFLNKYINLI